MKQNTIRRKTLEEALNYLVCPLDQAELQLNIGNFDLISEGELKCGECKKVYEIRKGVPYFFESGNGFEWKESDGSSNIAASITETLENMDLTWSKIIALSPFFLRRYGDRKKAIDGIFGVVEDVMRTSEANNETKAYLTQAATAVRYDTEVYRGTFKLPRKVLNYLVNNYSAGRGIAMEGACATGDCLLQIAESIDSKFYMGLDISGMLAREAQKKATDNVLFVQGDISSLPLKKSAGEIYILNNVFDRVVNPRKASSEANRILKAENSFFVLSNCDPLQFGYTTDSGLEIAFVPKENQLSLEEGLKVAGFQKVVEQKGIWKVETIAYGVERLPYKSLVGGR